MIAGYRLECDTCHRAWITAVADNIDAARGFAARYGWTTAGVADTCPRCSRSGSTAAAR